MRKSTFSLLVKKVNKSTEEKTKITKNKNNLKKTLLGKMLKKPKFPNVKNNIGINIDS